MFGKRTKGNCVNVSFVLILVLGIGANDNQPTSVSVLWKCHFNALVGSSIVNTIAV